MLVAALFACSRCHVQDVRSSAVRAKALLLQKYRHLTPAKLHGVGVIGVLNPSRTGCTLRVCAPRCLALAKKSPPGTHKDFAIATLFACWRCHLLDVRSSAVRANALLLQKYRHLTPTKTSWYYPVMPGLTRDAGSERRIARHPLQQAE